MKKFVLPLMLCVTIAISCCSCGFLRKRQTYYCDVNAVKSVQIVRLDKYIEGEYRYDYTVLCEISDYSTFVSNLNDIEHSINWGDPRQMQVQYIAIKIDYRNGDFDLIHSDAQCFNNSGVNNYGYFFFDEKQFNALISEYVTQGTVR